MNIAEFKVKIDGVDITNTLTNKRMPNGVRSDYPISYAFDNNTGTFLHSINTSDQNQFLADFEFTHTNSTTISIIITGRNHGNHGGRANGNYVTVEDRQGNLLAPQQTVNDLRNGATETFNFVYTT